MILRETLAKVMQAINELPETEKRLVKERYLDESSYKAFENQTMDLLVKV